MARNVPAMITDHDCAVSVTRHIAASAETVWELVSDVTRMGQWSPETTGGRWRRGATGPTVGAKFRGKNTNGTNKWSTTCTVTDCETGTIFAFDSKSFGLSISRWEYRFDSTDDGCQTTESWIDQRGRLVKALSPRVSGVRDRAVHNESTMRATLENLALAAEEIGQQ